MGLRRKESPAEERLKVTASRDAYLYLQNTFSDLNHEEFWILLLDRSNRIMGKHLISKGGQAGTVADPKMIFKVALEHNAASIVLAHNHPSGNLNPSDSDDKITRSLVTSGQMLNLLIADHLIFGHNNYYSYRDQERI